jgi:hypothetical protein
VTSRPSAGARFLLELEARVDGDATVVYRATVYQPDRETAYRAELTMDGGASLVPVSAPAEASLEDMLLMIARLTARGARKRHEDSMPPWPQRVTRWRGPGR